jgi:hypothetical protein
LAKAEMLKAEMLKSERGLHKATLWQKLKSEREVPEPHFGKS